MTIDDNINKMAREVQETSLAMELVKDYKKANTRMFIIILILIAGLLCSIGYIVYILNDIETVTTTDTIDVSDVNSVDNSNIKIGDDRWETYYSNE